MKDKVFYGVFMVTVDVILLLIIYSKWGIEIAQLVGFSILLFCLSVMRYDQFEQLKKRSDEKT